MTITSPWYMLMSPKYSRCQHTPNVIQIGGVMFLRNSSRLRCSLSVQESLAEVSMSQISACTLKKVMSVTDMKAPVTTTQQFEDTRSKTACRHAKEHAGYIQVTMNVDQNRINNGFHAYSRHHWNPVGGSIVSTAMHHHLTSLGSTMSKASFVLGTEQASSGHSHFQGDGIRVAISPHTWQMV